MKTLLTAVVLMALLFVLLALLVPHDPLRSARIAKQQDDDVMALARAQVAERNARMAVSIVDFKWRKSAGGALLEVAMTLGNKGSGAVRDVAVTCTTFGASGTAIHEDRTTVFAIVPAQGQHTTGWLRLGFVPQQTTSADCRVTGFEPN